MDTSTIGVKSDEEIETLTKMSMTPLMERNMIPLSYDDIKNMYILHQVIFNTTQPISNGDLHLKSGNA